MQPSQFSEKEIREQLDIILNDPLFTASSRLKKFFRFIVEETLSGNAGQLKAYTIATSIFNRGRDFDPQQDPVVRVETAKLRNKLMEYYYSSPNPGPVRIDVPKGAYIPTFTKLSGAFLAKSKGEMARSPLNAPITSSHADVDPEETHSPTQITVAVLPFINLSSEDGNNEFIQGLADEITVALTRFDDFSIVSSYSTRNLDSTGANIYSIAKTLGVRFILHGSVQFNNNIIRLRAELADSVTGSNIWAERFDYAIDDKEIFAIQEETAQQLVSRIGDSFGSIRRKLMYEASAKNTDDLHLYETMLRYHHWMPTFNPDLFKQAKQALEKAVEQDSKDPVILATLADLYASDYQLGYDTVPNALDKAQEFALKAIALDASSQTAHWALALNFFLRRNRAQFEHAIAEVVPLNPANSYMLVATGLLIGLAGDIEGGLALMDRALQLNPRSPGWYRIVSYFKYYKAKEYEAALNEALLINIPGCFWDPMLRAAVYGQLNYNAEARQAIHELLTIQPDFEEDHKRYILTLAFSDESAASLEEGIEKAGLRLKRSGS